MIDTRRIDDVSGIVGKTVKAYSEDFEDNLIISFTDGTYFVISVDTEDDRAWLEMGIGISPRDYGTEVLAHLFGWEDAEEMMRQEKERLDRLREESNAKDLEYQRAQYEHLKKIFEPQS